MRMLFMPICAATSMILATGCGGGEGRVPVAGTININGAPMDDGAIVFLPTTAKDVVGARVGGQIRNGKYAIDAGRGPVPGKYKVELHWNKKTGKKQQTADGSQEETAEGLPEKFNTATTLTADITSGSNKVDFDLKADPVAPKSAPAAPTKGRSLD